jgi:uncharacterized protein
MNLQERDQLNLFLQQLTQVQASQKDPEADGLIRDACARQPDAGYLLVQRAMQLEHALKAMKDQCAQLQAELDKARPATQSGFMNDVNAWGRPVMVPAAPTAPAAPTVASSIQPRAPAPVAAAAPASSWGSGILGNVATTAAGVVAGSFLFQGIQNMMGHHNQSGFGASNADAHSVPPVAENTVINNYYDSSGPDDAVDVADAGSDLGGDDSA